MTTMTNCRSALLKMRPYLLRLQAAPILKVQRSRQLVKRISVIVIFFLLSGSAFCDSPVLQLYKQRFSRADLGAKVQILENAANDRTMDAEIGQFYEYALQFALDNSKLLKNDHDMIRIVDAAVRGLQNTNYSESLNVLWKLFLEYIDTTIGAEIIIAMGKLGKGNNGVIDHINNYLSEKNFLYRAGDNVNYAMVSACISAIMDLGDSTSYPVLLAVLYSGFPEVITYEAQGAFDLIPGNLKQFLYDVIAKGEPVEKFAAYRVGVNSQRLNLAERGQLAELALEQSLIAYDGQANADMSALRYAAVNDLAKFRWTRANPLAIRHYYRVQADYQHDVVTLEHFLEAIRLLGAVGNSDAALVLILQLGLINSRTQRTGEYNENITLAIVQALGQIGERAAFDPLLNVSNLPYSENILAAAREAINRLRW
jgi:hypothetical protein